MDGDTIMLQPFPRYDIALEDAEAIAQINWLKDIITAVRNIRAESNIAPGKGLDLLLRNISQSEQNCLENNRTLLQVMAKLNDIRVLAQGIDAPLSVTKLVGQAELFVPMAGFINKDAELARLNKEIEKLQHEVQRIETKLANDAFVAKAPPAVIAKEREKMQGYRDGLEKLQQQYLAIEAL